MAKDQTSPATDLISNQLVRYLEGRGIKHIFGLCGHTNIAVLSSLANSPVRYVNVRHEQISAHAADGYARVTGKASVLLSHLSPGLTNAATGVANAAMDCIPMVVIAGDVPSYYYGKHPHQEVNLHADASQYEIYRPFVKRAWRVDTAELLPEILEKAFLLAESGQPGPVLVNVPMDIFSAEIDVALWDRLRGNTKTLTKPSIDDETARDIITKLTDASAPILYVGGGVASSRAYSELRKFVDHMQIPVTHSLMGKGVLPDDHPMMLGMTGFWGMKFTNDQTLAADWILADLREAMPRDAILTSDVGWNKNGVAQQFDIYTPGSILIPGGFATMGFGPPAAIGAKIAAPDRVVVSLVGDGGFGQNPAMLATAAAENTAVVWIIMNNNAYGTIAGLQLANYGLTHGTVFPKAATPDEQTPNYAAIARAYGCDGVKISCADAFKPALEAVIASGRPTVIDVAMINNPTPTSGH
jgi:thiamine pyrophosphate-dependent acetolactate synthase large subunit-like protein